MSYAILLVAGWLMKMPGQQAGEEGLSWRGEERRGAEQRVGWLGLRGVDVTVVGRWDGLGWMEGREGGQSGEGRNGLGGEGLASRELFKYVAEGSRASVI